MLLLHQNFLIAELEVHYKRQQQQQYNVAASVAQSPTGRRAVGTAAGQEALNGATIASLRGQIGNWNDAHGHGARRTEAFHLLLFYMGFIRTSTQPK